MGRGHLGLPAPALLDGAGLVDIESLVLEREISLLPSGGHDTVNRIQHFWRV